MGGPRVLTARGRTMSISQWALQPDVQVGRRAIDKRLDEGMTVEEALFTPRVTTGGKGTGRKLSDLIATIEQTRAYRECEDMVTRDYTALLGCTAERVAQVFQAMVASGDLVRVSHGTWRKAADRRPLYTRWRQHSNAELGITKSRQFGVPI